MALNTNPSAFLIRPREYPLCFALHSIEHAENELGKKGRRAARLHAQGPVSSTRPEDIQQTSNHSTVGQKTINEIHASPAWNSCRITEALLHKTPPSRCRERDNTEWNHTRQLHSFRHGRTKTKLRAHPIHTEPEHSHDHPQRLRD